MGSEITNFFLVWTIVVASLIYCHTMTKFFPSTGISRALLILPIPCLFFVLPLNLKSLSLAGPTSFFIAWMASFKLILFAFNQGPLSSNPPIRLPQFIPLACFPIRLQTDPPNPKTSPKSALDLSIRVAIIASLFGFYAKYLKFTPYHLRIALYSVHLYLVLEMLLVLSAGLAKALFGFQLEPQFDEPYLATSLQDFWGRRWNLAVTGVLHPTVYVPIRKVAAWVAPRDVASGAAVIVTFLVSGLMHELVFYNIGRKRPTGATTLYFLVNGVGLAAEMAGKKVLGRRFRPPGIVSRVLTMGFMVATTLWLFFPPFLASGVEMKACTEALAILEFVRNRRVVDPNDLSCPFS